MSNDNYVWTESYRPVTIEDCILPKSLKETFQGFVREGEFQNLLLCGGPGCGKTTVARALCKEMQLESYLINASEEGNIDMLRTRIKSFATSMSMLSDKPKVVILDEADNTTAAFQAALRGFTEQLSSNCRFILTCNYKNKIIEPIHSRCTVIDFRIPNTEKVTLAIAVQKRCEDILNAKKIKYNEKALATLVLKFFPDFRRILNELQRYSISGVVDAGILTPLTDSKFKELVKSIKGKDYSDVRKWVGENADGDMTMLARRFFDIAKDIVEPHSVPNLVIILADYSYKNAFVADPEINIMAMMCELMVELEWK